MKKDHGDEMKVLVASICEQLPDHAVLLIISGKPCGTDAVSNLPLFEQAQLLANALTGILNQIKGTLQ